MSDVFRSFSMLSPAEKLQRLSEHHPDEAQAVVRTITFLWKELAHIRREQMNQNQRRHSA